MTKLSVALAFAMWAAVAGAHAQTYPSRPVTVIVPFAAGGVTDIVARIVSERMKTALGQSVIIRERERRRRPHRRDPPVSRGARRLHPRRRAMDLPRRRGG